MLNNQRNKLENNHLRSKNYGMGGAISVVIFIVTAILGMFAYQSTMSNEEKAIWGIQTTPMSAEEKAIWGITG